MRIDFKGIVVFKFTHWNCSVIEILMIQISEMVLFALLIANVDDVFPLKNTFE